MKLARLPTPLLFALVQWATAERVELDRRTIPAYRWMNPFPEDGLVRRQYGYHPEFGGCDYTGEMCEEACGGGYEECSSGTELALFCYDPTKDQVCCQDDSGRACDRGYYCAKGRDRTWCCPEGLSIADCEALFSENLTSIDPNPSTTSLTTTTTKSGGGDGGDGGDGDNTPTKATTTETETLTETLTVGGETVLSTTILAPQTQTITETLTITVPGEEAGSERTVTLTSEITVVNTQTIVLGGGGGQTGTSCAAGGTTCTEAGGGPVVVTSSTTSQPAVISEGAAAGWAAPDALGMAVLALLGLVEWAMAL